MILEKIARKISLLPANFLTTYLPSLAYTGNRVAEFASLSPRDSACIQDRPMRRWAGHRDESFKLLVFKLFTEGVAMPALQEKTLLLNRGRAATLIRS
jgi:hypothetical protein